MARKYDLRRRITAERFEWLDAKEPVSLPNVTLQRPPDEFVRAGESDLVMKGRADGAAHRVRDAPSTLYRAMSRAAVQWLPPQGMSDTFASLRVASEPVREDTHLHREAKFDMLAPDDKFAHWVDFTSTRSLLEKLSNYQQGGSYGH